MTKTPAYDGTVPDRIQDIPYTYRSSGFLPASRAFARPGSGRLAITSPRPQRGELGGGAKARHRRLRGVVRTATGRSASQGNAAKPGGRAPPSVPAWCLRQTPRPTGTAHVTLTFGSQVYYQYYVFGISYYDGVSLYVRLRLGIPSRLPPACPRRGSLLKPWYPSLPHALYSRYSLPPPLRKRGV